MSTQEGRSLENVRHGRGPGPRDDTCLICSILFGPDTESTTHQDCDCTFCCECLDRWVEEGYQAGRHVTCPNCRGIIARPPRRSPSTLSIQVMLTIPPTNEPPTPPPYHFSLEALPREELHETSFQAYDLRADTWVIYPRHYVPIDVDTHLAATIPTGRSARNDPWRGTEGTPLPLIHVQGITNSSEPTVRTNTAIQPNRSPYAFRISSLLSQTPESESRTATDTEPASRMDTESEPETDIDTESGSNSQNSEASETREEEYHGHNNNSDVSYVDRLEQLLQEGESRVRALRQSMTLPFGAAIRQSLDDAVQSSDPDVMRDARDFVTSFISVPNGEIAQLREAIHAVDTIGLIEEFTETPSSSRDISDRAITMLDQILDPLEQGEPFTRETTTALNRVLQYVQSGNLREEVGEQEGLTGATNASTTSVLHQPEPRNAHDSRSPRQPSDPTSTLQPATIMLPRQNEFYARLLRLTIGLQQENHPLYDNLSAIQWYEDHVLVLTRLLTSTFMLRDQSSIVDLLDRIDRVVELLERVIHQPRSITWPDLDDFVARFEGLLRTVRAFGTEDGQSLHLVIATTFTSSVDPDELLSALSDDNVRTSDRALDAVNIYNETEARRERRLTRVTEALQARYLTPERRREAQEHLSRVHNAYRSIEDVNGRILQGLSTYHQHRPVTLSGADLMEIADERLQRHREEVQHHEMSLVLFTWEVDGDLPPGGMRGSGILNVLAYPRWIRLPTGADPEARQEPGIAGATMGSTPFLSQW